MPGGVRATGVQKNKIKSDLCGFGGREVGCMDTRLCYVIFDVEVDDGVCSAGSDVDFAVWTSRSS